MAMLILSASIKRFSVLKMRDFLFIIFLKIFFYFFGFIELFLFIVVLLMLDIFRQIVLLQLRDFLANLIILAFFLWLFNKLVNFLTIFWAIHMCFFGNWIGPNPRLCKKMYFCRSVPMYLLVSFNPISLNKGFKSKLYF